MSLNNYLPPLCSLYPVALKLLFI